MESDTPDDLPLERSPLQFEPHDPVEDSSTRKMLPQRYQIRADGDDRVLTCAEAANVSVVVRRGQSISQSTARKAAECSIFLDGYAQGEPFMDVQRRVYNLDHHEGCVRTFTLATCEQVLVLLLKGLDLEVGRWRVWANEPDLDTVLAIWLLLNHRRLTGRDGRLRRRVTPLVRLQGVIDAHGLEMQEFSGFPDPLRREMLGRVNQLRAPELALKQAGDWGQADGAEFVLSVLHLIDEMMYSPRDFEGMAEIDEISRISLTDGRLAVACRSDLGIYEVEEFLRDIHGDRLGLIVLETGDGRYTLRQSDPFLTVGLAELYDRLNLIDPAVSGEARWGGSEEIGGSPRGVGTHLPLSTIMDTAAWVYRPRTLTVKLRATARSVAAGFAAVGLGAVFANGGSLDGLTPGWLAAAPQPAWIVFAGALVVLTALLAGVGAHRHPGLLGLRKPRGWSWLGLVPVVALGAAGGGLVEIAGHGRSATSDTTWSLVLMLLLAVSLELLFRSVVHGLALAEFRAMRPRGRWMLSVPTMVSAGVWSAAAAWLLVPPTFVASWFGSSSVAVWLVCLVVTGLALGAVRERAGSVWAAAFVHILVLVGLLVAAVVTGW